MTFKQIVGLVLLAALAAVAGLMIYTALEVRRIRRAYPPIGQFVPADGLRLHYVREGDGEPVVMLHGRDGTLQEFTFSFFGQAAEHYDAIAFDRPGYGYSEWPEDERLSLEVQARLIHQGLSQLSVEDPLLVGHSYGGAVVLRYLLDYPDEVRGAVLLAPAGSLFAFPNIPIVGPFLTHTILLPVGRKVAEGMYEQAFWPDPAPEAYVETMKALYLRPANFTATAGELAVMQDSVQAISPRYGEIQVPVIILAGSSDQMVDVKGNAWRLAEALPNGELVLVEGTGHKLHHTHPDVVMDAIDEVMEASGR